VCGELIAQKEARCPYCGEDVGEEEERPWERRQRRPVRRDCEPHRGQLVLILGIVSLVALACGGFGAVVGLPCAIIAWILGTKDLARMEAGTMDPEGQGITQAGRVCGIVGTIIDSLLMLACIAYLGFIALMMVTQK
jgi:hypothetical protein